MKRPPQTAPMAGDQGKEQTLATVTSFKHLGAIVSDEGSKPEVLSSIAQATAALTKLKPIF